ncbi:hypothetical protein [Actinomyces sp. W5033]|uniref:hypothetical protein n=1 Tax=Actinomyces sp. W5033 TaxID=3446479 RepID=UPI003EDF25A9
MGQDAADPKQVVDEFVAYLRRSASQFASFGARVSQYSDSATGVTHRGYEIERYDYPTVEETNPSPLRLMKGEFPTSKDHLYYWGGTWGHRIVFLTEEGQLFEYEFKGADILEGIDIRTETRDRVSKLELRRVLGNKKPFMEIRNKIDRRLAEEYARSL